MPGPSTSAIPPTPLGMWTDCRLCGCRLNGGKTIIPGMTDDWQRGLCRDCQNRPEAARFGPPSGSAPARTGPPPSRTGPPASRTAPSASISKMPRAFNPAEKSLIRSVHSYMPAAQLLEILNTRLVADVGAAAVPFTLQQLQADTDALVTSSAGDGEWASLRKMLGKARASGLLATLTLQMVDDFSVVYGLSSAQHMRLREIVRNAQQETR